MEKVLKINVPEGYEVDKEKSTFESIVFRVLPEKKLPESWEDMYKVDGFIVDENSVITSLPFASAPRDRNRNLWPTREEAEASIALAQLLQLRDRYNGDWRPDWSYDTGTKYGIVIEKEGVRMVPTSRTRMPLHFKSRELVDKFLSCPEIRKLIEIAKPLL